MTFRPPVKFIALFVALIFLCNPVLACTSFIITPGASADGSMYVAHTNDGFGSGVVGHAFVNESTVLAYVPAADHAPGSMRAVYFDPTSGSDEPTKAANAETTPLGYIPEVNHTYAYFTGSYGIMNEHQLMAAEVTTGGKIEPSADAEKRLFYTSELSNIALERCKTAKEAVTLVGQLIDQYGYYGTGETLLFGDTKEAWVIEICGGTPDGKGGLWVAQKVPDGTVFVTANSFRIRDVIPGNPDQMYSANLFTVAKENGWWNESQGNLDWLPTVSYGEYSHPYYSLSRLWSLYHRLAPSQNFTPYVTDTYSEAYPFSVKPDKLLTTADAFALFRDHYEGTVFDLTNGSAAGPFGNPYRWRGAFDDHGQFAAGEVKPGAWPRAVSEIFCGYSYINQGRSWLTDSVGGITWFGFAPPAETVYIPFYAGITSVPAEWSVTDRSTFSRDYAWWAWNYVTNWATINYRAIIVDIKANQQGIENRQFADQPIIEKTAQQLYATQGEDAARAYLTNYSATNAEANREAWWGLSDRLIVKYSNMMVNDFANDTTYLTGYPNEWLQNVSYQYGPRIYEYPELQEVQGLAYVNETVYTTPGNELNLIKTTQRMNISQSIMGILEGWTSLTNRHQTGKILERSMSLPIRNQTRWTLKPS